MVVPPIPSKTGWPQLKSGGGHQKFFSALCAEIITTTTVPFNFQNLFGAYGLLLVRIALTARWIATLLLLVLLVGYYY